MRAGTFAFAVIRLACCTIAAPLVTFESPCNCRANHGKRRWAVKNARGRFQRAVSRLVSGLPSPEFAAKTACVIPLLSGNPLGEQVDLEGIIP